MFVYGRSPPGVQVLVTVIARMFLGRERSACACVCSLPQSIHAKEIFGDSNRRERAVCVL